MNQQSPTRKAQEIRQILRESLEGGEYDLETLERALDSETRLDEFLDSLDITDFVLRLEHHYQISIAQEEFGGLNTLAAIEDYVGKNSPVVVDQTVTSQTGNQTPQA